MWDLFYVVIVAYKRKLITRDEFIRHWKVMQSYEQVLQN